MLKLVRNENNKKLLFFFLFMWILGVITASFWGLGWFFLVETLRRIITYVPPLRRLLMKVILGTDLEGEIKEVDPATKMFSNIMSSFIIVVWIGLTIFVFLKANITLFDIFS